jgi:hypothetical protein
MSKRNHRADKAKRNLKQTGNIRGLSISETGSARGRINHNTDK